MFLLALDLGVIHRQPQAPKFRSSLGWSLLWFLFAMSMAAALALGRGAEEGLQFLAGYLVEYSLSLDNIFAMALIFAWFRVPSALQHRVLFWGILGALLTRGVMIGAGAELLQKFHWILYVMGAFLFCTGLRWAFSRQAVVQPERNLVVRLARKLFPITRDFEGRNFFSRVEGRRALTPLALALLTIEATDLVFATDSIPAVFAVTQSAFIVFTSNLCAVLGLRSLYFLLAGALRYFRHLKTGLSLVLVFIGAKMLLSRWRAIPNSITLAVVAGVIAVSIFMSRAGADAKEKAPHPEPPE